jgi:hypothetical protein
MKHADGYDVLMSCLFHARSAEEPKPKTEHSAERGHGTETAGLVFTSWRRRNRKMEEIWYLDAQNKNY